MKRIISLLTAVVALLFVVSCSSSSTPTEVVEKYVKCVMTEDYESAMNLFSYSSADPEKVAANKARMVKMFERFVKPELDKNEGIKGYEIGEEVISEDGLTATVTFDYIYGNGKVDDQKSKLKLVDGEWYLDSGK